MKKIVYQLPHDELKHIEAYMYIEVEKRFKENGEPYMFTDSYYTNLARASRALVLEKDKLRPFFHIIHLGGGMMQDETYQTDLVVNDRSDAIFTSQSANKVLRCLPGHQPTVYNVNIQVGEDAMAEFLNDSIILYETTRYKQKTNIYLTKTSRLIYTEIFGPGWSKDEVDYTYGLMDLKTEIKMDNHLVLYDNLVFEPQKDNPSVFGVMDRYRRCGTGLFILPEMTEEHRENIRKLVKEQFPNDNNYYELGISSLSVPSLVVRILADEVFEIQHILHAIHKYVREQILGLPMINIRKQ